MYTLILIIFGVFIYQSSNQDFLNQGRKLKKRFMIQNLIIIW